MTSFQMDCFLEAAKELNFSRAAQNLFISQPALSRHISALEKELNISLFQRSANKRISLTDAGTEYFDLYLRFRKESDILKSKFEHQMADPFGKFSFGYLSGWDISFFLPDILSQFEKEQPGVEVKFESLPPSEIISRIESGRLDVALIPWEYVQEAKHVRWESVVYINNIVLYSDRFIQANPEIFTIKDMKNSTFFYTPDTLHMQRRELFGSISAEMGFTPKISTIPNEDTLMSYVKAGMGVMLTDGWGRNAHAVGFGKIPLTEPRRIVLVWPENVTHRLPYKITRELKEILLAIQDEHRCFNPD